MVARGRPGKSEVTEDREEIAEVDWLIVINNINHLLKFKPKKQNIVAISTSSGLIHRYQQHKSSSQI